MGQHTPKADERDSGIGASPDTDFCLLTQGRLAYAEIPGAQHGFDIFPSRRSLLVMRGVERFLAHLHAEYLLAAEPAPARQAGHV